MTWPRKLGGAQARRYGKDPVGAKREARVEMSCAGKTSNCILSGVADSQVLEPRKRFIAEGAWSLKAEKLV